MSSANGKTYLITGANSGLGLEATRQLASQNSTKVVYMACRNLERGKAAREALLRESATMISAKKLVICHFDASSSRKDIESQLTTNLLEPLDGILLNAGGMGHDASGKPIEPNGVLDTYQINLLGHIHLLQVLEPYLVPQRTVIVASGSELARGVPSMASPAPKLASSVDGYQDMMRGGESCRFDATREYGRAKALVALYWAAWARRHPEVHVLTVSPGMTQGTSLGLHKSLSPLVRAVFPAIMAASGILGVAQPVEHGARKYIDALQDQGCFTGAPSGAFFAAAGKRPSGISSMDQGPDFQDERIQEMVFEAVTSVAQ